MNNLIKVTAILAVLLISFLIAGCSTTTKTTTVFDEKGTIVAQEVLGEKDAFDKVTNSTKEKTIFVWSNGWFARLRFKIPFLKDAFQFFDMTVGELNTGRLHIKDGAHLQYVKDAINATKESLTANKEGVKNE